MSDGGVAGVADMCWGGVGDSAPLNRSSSGSGGSSNADWKANDGRAGVSAGLIQTSVTGPFVHSTRCSTAVDQGVGGGRGERGGRGEAYFCRSDKVRVRQHTFLQQHKIFGSGLMDEEPNTEKKKKSLSNQQKNFTADVCVCVCVTDPAWRSKRGSPPGIRSTAAGQTDPRGDCSTSGCFGSRAPTRGPG